MARLYLIRHGRAAAGFGESRDPGLDQVGVAQASDVAQKLSALGPLPILSSPLARARETAAPLARIWRCEPVIESAVAEIPSPEDNLEERVHWLRAFMAGSWQQASASLVAWRRGVVNALLARNEDTVIFSHFIAINVAVGAAVRDDRVVVVSPDNCSITIFETENATLKLVEKGHEAPLTKVN